jgi:hypothetical protein
MLIETQIHYTLNTKNGGKEDWYNYFLNNSNLNIIQQFREIMMTSVRVVAEIRKTNKKEFNKIDIYLNQIKSYEIKSNSKTQETSKYMPFSYIESFDWKNIENKDIALIISTNFNGIIISLSQNERNLILNLAKDNTNKNILNKLENFTPPKPQMSINNDSTKIKSIKYFTPIKYRLK